MWRILQHHTPDDFVLATGETHSVREFVEKSFDRIGVSIGWMGTGENEKGVARSVDRERLAQATNGKGDGICLNDTLVELDPNYLRPTEVDLLIGDPAKAERELGWKTATGFEELVEMMVDADLKQMGEPIMNF